MNATLDHRSPPASPTIRRGLALVISVTTLLGCSPGYIARAAWEEARILARRRSLDEMLSQPTLDTTIRDKLELVVQARSFAQRHLQLDVGDSYTSYADIGRDTLAFVLSASPPDRLAAHTWWFPIVGRVPYKGFFSLAAAEKERASLERRKYDTYLRATSTFSTLGWLPDPLLSTVLQQDSIGLVDTVIHEVTHNTLFIPGQVRFNESFANFVGSVGAIEFFCRAGYDSTLCDLARGRWHDSVQLSRFLDQLWDELDALYAQRLPLDSLMPHRQALLEHAAARFREDYAPAMRTRSFARYDPTRLNNASLLARHLYYHRLPLFQQLFDRSGGLTETINLVAAATRHSDDPWTGVAHLARSNDRP